MDKIYTRKRIRLPRIRGFRVSYGGAFGGGFGKRRKRRKREIKI